MMKIDWTWQRVAAFGVTIAACGWFVYRGWNEAAVIAVLTAVLPSVVGWGEPRK